MPDPVSLKDIVETIEAVPGEMTAYLDSRTGLTYIIGEEDLSDPEVETVPAWGGEAPARLADILETDRFLALPDRFEIDDYRIMQRFCGTIADDGAREAAYAAISGRGAFRRFRATVERLGLLEEWYSFRDRSYADIARDWLEAHQIPYVDDVGSTAERA